jgi:hypothetical protein
MKKVYSPKWTLLTYFFTLEYEHDDVLRVKIKRKGAVEEGGTGEEERGGGVWRGGDEDRRC